jgi:hypothetical protein
MPIYLHQTVIPALCLCMAACGSDTTGTLGLVALCPQGIWAAMQREGQPWRAIAVTRAQYSLVPGERIGLARIRRTLDGLDSLEIDYVTAEQGAATFSCDSPPTVSSRSKELHGTLQGVDTLFTDVGALGTPARAAISVGFRQTFVGALGNDFTVFDIPGGTSDLVAAAVDVSRAAIIRRGVDYPDGSTIPVLDFSSSEAFGLDANTVTLAGNPQHYDWSLANQVVTQRGTIGLLRYGFVAGATNTAAIYSVPENKLLDGELNSLTVFVALSYATTYYRAPSDRTIEPGPQANLPTVTRSDVPDLITRIEAVSQPEYGSQIRFTLGSPLNAVVNFSPTIIASKEYFGGTPATWTFTIPNFRGIGDFSQSYGDLPTSGVNRFEVTDRPYLAPPRDGVTYRSATR